MSHLHYRGQFKVYNQKMNDNQGVVEKNQNIQKIETDFNKRMQILRMAKQKFFSLFRLRLEEKKIEEIKGNTISY